MDETEYFTRKGGGEYMLRTYHVGAPRYLAKLATLGGGPRHIKMGGRVLYKKADLDEWARERMSAPRVSTSDDGTTRKARPSKAEPSNNDRPQRRKESRPQRRGKARDRRAVV